MWSIERWFSDGFTVVSSAYVKVLLKNIIRRKDTSKAIKQKIKNTSSRSKQGKGAIKKMATKGRRIDLMFLAPLPYVAAGSATEYSYVYTSVDSST